ncbi:MAG: EamA family transporter [Candidatus Cybelea sp.]
MANAGTARRDLPHAYFVVSALFHYLGPAFAVLLFARLDVSGVAWLRIATAATTLALWRRPWSLVRDAGTRLRLLLVTFGVVLAAMNLCFYFAISALPLGTVGAIEFLGPIILALLGLRTLRNVVGLVACTAGVYALTHVTVSGSATAYAFAFANCGLFMLYVVLGHWIARSGAEKGIDTLGAAMCVALVAITPIGLCGAVSAFANPTVLFAGVVVGLTSSVIPYVCDQLAMTRLPRSSFALLLSLLPLTATIVGIVILHQIPSHRDVAGVILVMTGVALHRVGDSV